MISKTIYRLLMLLPVAAALISCSGKIEDEPIQDLYLTADKVTIDANGKDIVTFTAMYGTTDVSDSKELTLSYKFNGGNVVEMSAGQVTFATKVVGSYSFTATYRLREGVEVTSENTFTVTAIYAGEVLDEYVRKVLAMQFTSTGCSNCPILSTYMKDIKKTRKEVSVAAFHTNYGGVSDPMTVNTTENLAKHFGYNSGFPLPFFALDMNLNITCPVQYGAIDALIADRLKKPASCGVAITSNFDKATGTLLVRARVTATEAKPYRYVILLVEDGIKAFQMGIENQTEANNYIHDNVVRAMLTRSLNGDALNGGQALTPGVEVSAERGVKLSQGWNLNNMRVIVAAMSSEDDIVFSCENVNECKAGENIAYQIK